MSLHEKTLAQLRDGLNSKEFSAVELAQHYLNRIKKYDGSVGLNSFISVDEVGVLAQAKLADELRQKKVENKPLLGLPIAHKDIFCTKGLKTSCGSKMLDNFVSPYDATVVARLKDAGMTMLGKLNMDEFAMGSSNETSFYGAVKNPWDLGCVPGGSSGGSSAAVAARLSPVATGTDTGGSIRQPAALTGITGLKPTYGRISRYGMVAFASSLDQAGPMAQTAEDCALLLNHMAGGDERDSTSSHTVVPDYTADLNQSVVGLKIGIPQKYFEQLDDEMTRVVMTAAKELESMGATLHDVELPHNDLSVAAYYVIAPAECSSNLSRFDGVRFGYRCDNPADLEDLYMRSRSEGFGDEVKRRILIGSYVLSAGYYDAYYLKAQKVRHLIADDFKAAFDSVDVVLGPTTPETAFKLGEKAKDPVSMYLSDIYTIAVNLAGLPAISVPCGFINGMPAGLQLIGNHFAESKLLNVAHQYQLQTDWHQSIPTDFQEVGVLTK